MITYAEQQAERKATFTTLAKRYGSGWNIDELRQIDAQIKALRELARTGWLPEREEAK